MIQNHQGQASDATCKEELREAQRLRNQSFSSEERAAQSRSLRDTLSSHSAWQAAHCIFAFVPRSDEPDILTLLRSALTEGKTIALPQFQKNSGIYRAAIIRDFNNDLSPGHYGIPEPVAHCTGLENQSVDLTLVPGMAFDSEGWRLGRGKGFYDRLLPSISGLRCGVAFDHQWVESVHARTLGSENGLDHHTPSLGQGPEGRVSMRCQ